MNIKDIIKQGEKELQEVLDGYYDDRSQLEYFLHTQQVALLKGVVEMIDGEMIDVPTRMIHVKQLGISESSRKRSRWKAEVHNNVLTKLATKLKENYE